MQHLRRVIKFFCLLRRVAMSAGGFTTQTFTLDAFMWAVAIVMTRQNNVPLGVERDGKATSVLSLVPVFDMANHEDGEFSTDFRTDAEAGGEGKGGLVCFAKRDFEQGEQLRIFYGVAPTHSPRPLLTHPTHALPNSRVASA